MAKEEQVSPPPEARASPTSRTVVFVPLTSNADILTFKAFLRATVPNYICPVCDNADFGYLQYFDPNRPSIIGLFTTNPNETNRTDYYTAFATSCTRCGNIQLFRQDVIEDWAKVR